MGDSGGEERRADTPSRDSCRVTWGELGAASSLDRMLAIGQVKIESIESTKPLSYKVLALVCLISWIPDGRL